MQEVSKKVLDTEDETAKEQIPDYVKVCAGLTIIRALDEDEVRDRAFHMLTGSVVFGILIAELADSFLIAASCILVSENGRIDGKSFSKAKVIRMMKTSVAFMSTPEAEHRSYYFKWLKKQYTSIPSFFSQERRDIIDSFVYNYDNRSKQTEQNEDQISEARELGGDDTKGSADSFWSPYTSMEFH